MTGIVAATGAKAVLSAAGARLGQISPKVWLALGCAVALVLGVLWHRHEVKVTIATAKAEQKATDQKVLDATVQGYRAAAAKAEAEDQAKDTATKAQQAKINQETDNDYQARLAAARALADRLRQQLAHSANPGSPAKPSVPGVSAPAGGPAQTAPDGLSIDDALTCTEQGIQLDELIKWVKRQAGVDPNAAVKP